MPGLRRVTSALWVSVFFYVTKQPVTDNSPRYQALYLPFSTLWFWQLAVHPPTPPPPPPPPPNLGKPKAWLLTFNDLTLKTGNQSPVSNSYRELDCAKDYDWLLKWRHCANGLVMHTPILRVHAIPGSFLVSIRYSVNTFRICDSQ